MKYILQTNSLTKKYKSFQALNGLTMNVPRFKRWRGSALRQFIEYRRGELTEDDLAAILADAEKKRTE